ncbi:MAG: hypothetical protein AB1806_12515 [Acidobacteriota bacterium]
MRADRILASAVLVGALAASACTSFFEVSIETPIRPKLDVSAFSRVFVAGFVAAGTEDVDANLETVRLLRSQLRAKGLLRVIDADVLPLTEVAAEQRKGETPPDGTPPPADLPEQITTEQDLELYEPVFANTDYWKKVGEEFQGPLIVTGTVMFTPHSRSGYVQREQEVYDSFGRRRVQPVRTYMERQGFILRPKFVFIDGRTGATLYTETFREEVLYSAQQTTPALSSYFELMDRLIPAFLTTLSSQKIKGSRVLLK